jgi:hypothetical protein
MMAEMARDVDVGRARLPNDQRVFAEPSIFAAPDQRLQFTRRAAGLQRVSILGFQNVTATQGFSARRVLWSVSTSGMRISNTLRRSWVEQEPRPTNRLLSLTTSK